MIPPEMTVAHPLIPQSETIQHTAFLFPFIQEGRLEIITEYIKHFYQDACGNNPNLAVGGRYGIYF